MHKFKDKLCDTQQPSKKGNYRHKKTLSKNEERFIIYLLISLLLLQR